MTPEVARREHAAAREAGTFANRWNRINYDYQPTDRSKPRAAVQFRPTRLRVLQAIADGDETLVQIAETMTGHSTPDQIVNTVRRFRTAAPWVFNVWQVTKPTNHMSLTDAGAALLAEWRAKG